MSARASIHPVGLLALLGTLLAAGPSAKGTSIVFAKFSAPIIQDNRLVFTSPNAKRLLCVNLDGKVAWEQKFEFPIRLFTGPENEALIQTGKVVSSVFPKSGEFRALFTVEGENDGVTYTRKLGCFVSHDLRFQQRMFKILDRKTGKAIWKTRDIEDIICGMPDLIVCLAAERIPSERGYSFGKASLDGYDRRSFTKRWSVPLPEGSGVPYVPAAFNAPYLVYTEGRTSLAVLDCTTGRKRLTKELQVPEYGQISDLEIYEGQLVWLTHKMARGDFNNTEHLLHFCTLPELREEKTVVLRLIEIARISFEGGYIISDALYRTACFQPEGEKVWERFQMERTSVVNNRMYFSDYHKKTTRLGYVDVPTGKETILYSEPVDEPKE
jgi:outer membrane protein assembly factor BamB